MVVAFSKHLSAPPLVWTLLLFLSFLLSLQWHPSPVKTHHYNFTSTLSVSMTSKQKWKWTLVTEGWGLSPLLDFFFGKSYMQKETDRQTDRQVCRRARAHTHTTHTPTHTHTRTHTYTHITHTHTHTCLIHNGCQLIYNNYYLTFLHLLFFLIIVLGMMHIILS
jgi:hypothetical protein